MVIIDPVGLRGVDLNVLVSLRVLLTQRHVTRSAEKLGLTQPAMSLTQPAMSASLARSRTLFRDKLLVRGPQGLVLTPRGEQILEQLNQIMEVTERLIALPEEFTPATSHRIFTLMGSDFVEFILLPSLMATIASEAPNLQILYKSPYRKNLEAMLANSESNSRPPMGIPFWPINQNRTEADQPKTPDLAGAYALGVLCWLLSAGFTSLQKRSVRKCRRGHSAFGEPLWPVSSCFRHYACIARPLPASYVEGFSHCLSSVGSVFRSLKV
jgi:Bacterial regulatory helix-turn-helix protein, lysR family